MRLTTTKIKSAKLTIVTVAVFIVTFVLQAEIIASFDNNLPDGGNYWSD